MDGCASTYAEGGGIHLHYWIGGDPVGLPVLLWHGFNDRGGDNTERRSCGPARAAPAGGMIDSWRMDVWATAGRAGARRTEQQKRIYYRHQTTAAGCIEVYLL
jgi:hypothetical protein